MRLEQATLRLENEKRFLPQENALSDVQPSSESQEETSDVPPNSPRPTTLRSLSAPTARQDMQTSPAQTKLELLQSIEDLQAHMKHKKEENGKLKAFIKERADKLENLQSERQAVEKKTLDLYKDSQPELPSVPQSRPQSRSTETREFDQFLQDSQAAQAAQGAQVVLHLPPIRSSSARIRFTGK